MDPNKIQGDVTGPFKQDPVKEPTKIDEEKFKKVLKIDSSDESKKRQKRDLKKEEEEGEDQEKLEDNNVPSSQDFSQHMQDDDEKGSIFDSTSKGTVRRPPAQGETGKTPSPYKISPKSFGKTDTESEYEEPPPIPSPPSDQEVSSPEPPPLSGDEVTPKEGPPPPSETSDFNNPPTFLEPEDQPFQDNKDQTDTSLLRDQPQKDILKKKKKKKTITAKEKVLLADKLKLEAKQIKEEKPDKTLAVKKGEKKTHLEKQQQGIAPKKSKTLSPKKAEEKPSKDDLIPIEILSKEGPLPVPDQTLKKPSAKRKPIFKRLNPKESRLRKKEKKARALMETPEAEDLALPLPGLKGSEKEAKKLSKEPDFPEATSSTAGIPLPSYEAPVIPLESTETPSYTKLSAEAYELLETMAGVILIQKDKTKTSTTITLNMPNSVFNGAKLVLDQYSTAPMIYNVQLLGSPEAIKAFEANQNTLSKSFEEAQYNFEVNILKPSLIVKSQKHLIRRKSETGGQKGKQDKEKEQQK